MRGGATFTTVMNNAAEVLTRAQEAGSVRRDLRPRDCSCSGAGWASPRRATTKRPNG